MNQRNNITLEFPKPRDAWDALSMKEKAEMIGVAVRNGITNLNDIRDRYNEFAEGGSKEEVVNTDEQYLTTMEKVAEDNHQKWGFSNPDKALLHALNDNTYNYRGYYGKYPQSKANADTHWTDEFKTVYHPTFSNESIYSGQKSQYNPLGLPGGFWSGDTFVPMAWQLDANEYKKGGSIHIKPSHRGRLTELKKRTGKTEAELYRTGGPAVRKMITFARNARKWKHGLGGELNNYNYGNTFGGGGLFGNETVDTVASFLPILGIAEDVYQFYQDPSWSNAGWLALSLGSDIFTGGMAARGIKALRAANKAVDAANAASKAAVKEWRAAKAANGANHTRESGTRVRHAINAAGNAGVVRDAAVRRANDALFEAGVSIGIDQGLNGFVNAVQNDMLPTFGLQYEQRHGLGGNLYGDGGILDWFKGLFSFGNEEKTPEPVYRNRPAEKIIIANSGKKYTAYAPKRVSENNSKTKEQSEKLENSMRATIRMDQARNRSNPDYDIPYIPEKSIIINGSTTSTNVLDSLAKYAGEYNRNPQLSQKTIRKRSSYTAPRKISMYEMLGLSTQETKNGAMPYFNFEKGQPSYNRALANSNYLTAFGSIPAEYLVRNYQYNDANIDRNTPPLLDAFRYYAQGDYNSNDHNHKSDVIAAGKEAWNNPKVKEWWETSGKYWYNNEKK